MPSRGWSVFSLVCALVGASCTTNGATGVTTAPQPSAAAPAAAPLPAAEPKEAPPPRFSAEVEARIERVIRGLLPAMELAGRFGAPAELSERMRYYHTPGVSIAVVEDGKVQWARGFGVRDATTNAPVTDETLFQAASISKPVFALAVMRLAQQGKVARDDDVNRALRSWKIPANGDWQATITLRQLLSHGAGLTVHGFPGYRTDEPLPTLVQILDGLAPANTAPVRVNILPGAHFRYAGGGTTVAQLLVTELLGQPLPRTMQELVLGPIGMAHSTYEQPLPERFRALAATAHPWKGTPLVGKWHVYPEMAAAGLWTTPGDLAKLGVEVQRAIRGESALLSKQSAEEMLTRQMEDVGVGFFLEGKDEALRFGHGGWNEGFVSKATFYAKAGKRAVVMVNSNEGVQILSEIERAIAREYGWVDYFKSEKKRAEMESAALDKLSGEYVSEKGFRVAIARNGGGLTLTVGRQSPLRLVAYEPGKFFAPNLNLEVTFKMNAKGRPESVVLQQDKFMLEAKRKP